MAACGRFIMAVSGGHTPWTMLRALAAQDLPWNDVHVFQVDERVAPAGHPDRNLTHLRESLLAHCPLRPEQVHAMPVDTVDLESASRQYAATLQQIAGTPPVLDLAHLGLAPDGHTASLFPQAEALREEHAWAIASPPGVLPPPVDRVTLTYPVLNAARQVVFLVSGSKKSAALTSARDPSTDPMLCPAAGVRPSDGELLWLVDREAAG